jgi:hypothetical protein
METQKCIHCAGIGVPSRSIFFSNGNGDEAGTNEPGRVSEEKIKKMHHKII